MYSYPELRLNSNIVATVAHEIRYIQQIGSDSENDGKSNLLGYCIREGMCDFLAKLTYQKISSSYMTYGKQNEKELWRQFQQEMMTQKTKNWLYNGNDSPNSVADLGYFIGYLICKSYYENAKNKKQAIRELLQLDYTPENLLKFLKKSNKIMVKETTDNMGFVRTRLNVPCVAIF